MAVGQEADQSSVIIVDDRSYLRKLVRTRWLDEHDDLVAVLLEYGCDRHPEDTIVVSETVSLLLTGRSLLVESFQPRWDARLLARFVRPHHDTLGLSIPSKMQWVLHTVGRPRIYTAAVAAAVTRLFGVQGTFYRIAGDPARQIDGGCPPYQDRLLPPFHPAEAVELCNELQTKLGNPVAIADINDFGGSIRAVSSRSLPATTLKRVLADNPMGQLRRGTPFILVRAT